MSEVVVVTGAGGMGLAIARRLAAGRRTLLADFSEPALTAAAEALRGDGHDVTTRVTDVSDREAVAALADAAAALGRVTHVTHRGPFAGTGPGRDRAARRPPRCRTGAGRVRARHRARGRAAGSAVPVTGRPRRAGCLRDVQARQHLARASRREHLGTAGLVGPSGHMIRAMIDRCGTGRIGTPDDVADAAAFLLGPHATFITGTDLLVDGGVVASMRMGAQEPPGTTSPDS